MPEHDPLLEAVLASGVKLPALEGTLLRLRALAADDNVSPTQLAAVVARDPALSGDFIRVANSPVFRTRNPARSVKAAITLLGRTRSLAVITSNALQRQLSGIPPAAARRIWAASLAAADGAYRAAQVSRLPRLADTAYLTGLVHDAGIAVVLHRFPDCAATLESCQGALDAAAREVDTAAGTDHAAIGGMIARNWKLPPEVAEAVFLHHRPAAVDQAEPHAAALATLVAIGRRLRDGPGGDWPAWAPHAEAHLGVGEQALEALAALAGSIPPA